MYRIPANIDRLSNTSHKLEPYVFCIQGLFSSGARNQAKQTFYLFGIQTFRFDRLEKKKDSDARNL